MRNRNYIRIKEGIKKINRKKILILIPIMYFLIIGCLTYAGEWLLGKMGSPYSRQKYHELLLNEHGGNADTDIHGV